MLALVAVCLAACGGDNAKKTAKARPTAGSQHSAVRASGPPAAVAKVPFPTNIAFDAKGALWVSSGSRGQGATDGIWYAPEGGKPRHVASGLAGALGLTWAGDALYVSHLTSARSGRVTALSGFDGSRFKHRDVVVDHIPVGANTMGSIIEGPDRRLYVKAGAVSDAGGPSGRVFSFAPGSRHTTTEADGLKSEYGLAFEGSRLFVTDSGRDDLGPNRPPDELNVFDPSGPVVDFGYPDCYDQGGPKCKGTRAPFATFAPHASSAGLAISGDVAYVTENGSASDTPATGNDVLRVDLRTGHHTVFWRSPVKHDPLGAAIGPDGNLYVTLYVSGEVARFDL